MRSREQYGVSVQIFMLETMGVEPTDGVARNLQALRYVTPK